ncbi:MULTISPECIES: YIP1 family protein [Paenibacillus]|uniref:YIP1 family protein n=1 Tax=Paenibacillus campinasensis TaxID=66347 RepID=A0A268F1J1_9BACL|nr:MULTISPECIES: YIP1 family protein [Paenibacillus]MUG65734.1 YIP1 family protein [Paenibacillus campinasensis]PAD79229.1 YIP1 family protein [Paenibacillus campinasensis]PAK54223.1 YIP1 family protein [Paenibacillus sp. 7541]
MSREWIRFPLSLMVHPFEGYWDLKYDRSRNFTLIISFSVLFLVAVTNILRSQYSGFLVHVYNPESMNSVMEIVYVIVPLLFWCVANWSLTTLMDGEGKFVEIFTSTCFALLPLVIIQFPWIWLSNLVSLEETAFYYFSNSVAVLWFVYLLFVGNMTVHQFSPSKTIGIMLLTLVAMGFMAFISLLFFSLVQQIVAFISVIYQELVMRT